jgi:hypothetical protein
LHDLIQANIRDYDNKGKADEEKVDTDVKFVED